MFSQLYDITVPDSPNIVLERTEPNGIDPLVLIGFLVIVGLLIFFSLRLAKKVKISEEL